MDGRVQNSAGAAPARDRDMDKPGKAEPKPMYTLADVLPAAVRLNTLECKRCGSEVNFVARQWRKNCSRCGLVITLPWVRWAEERKKEPDCHICLDKGLVFYQEQRGQLLYNFVARCTCPAGLRRRETAFPRVDQVDNIGSLDYLVRQNRALREQLSIRQVGDGS